MSSSPHITTIDWVTAIILFGAIVAAYVLWMRVETIGQRQHKTANICHKIDQYLLLTDSTYANLDDSKLEELIELYLKNKYGLKQNDK